MKKLMGSCAVLVLLLLTGTLAAEAQEDIKGRWAAEYEDPAMVNLSHTVQLANEKRSFHESSRFSLDELRGLSRANTPNPVRVQFEIQRDAGTIVYEGYGTDRDGAGNFSFYPSSSFKEAAATYGYKDISIAQLFMMTVQNVGLTFMSELSVLGYKELAIDQLLAMRIHGVSSDYVKNLKGIVAGHPSADVLISLRIAAVDADFLNKVKTAGYQELTVSELLRLRGSLRDDQDRSKGNRNR